MRKSQKPKLTLSSSEMEKLVAISKSQTAPHREVIRANILLKWNAGMTITGIANDLKTNRPKVERCIKKAIGYGFLSGLKDLPGRGVKPTITDDAKQWVL